MRLASVGTQFSMQSDVVDIAAIVEATRAAPCLLTLTLSPDFLLLDEVVRIDGTNWGSLRDQTFGIAMHSGRNVLLQDSDTRREPGPLGAGTLQQVVLGESCQATFTLSAEPGSDIDITSICSPTRRTMPGDAGAITWEATGFWDRDDPFQKRARDLYQAGTIVAFKVMFRDGSGFLFSASIKRFDITAGVDQAVAFNLGGTLVDIIRDLPPPLGPFAPTRIIDDPNYCIRPVDNGWCLVWDSVGDATWCLPGFDQPMEVTLLRGNGGELAVVDEQSTVASAYDDFDEGPHRAVALPFGQIHCRLWRPATWLVAGETKAIIRRVAPTRIIDDPDYQVQASDNGYCLVWDDPATAAWRLPAHPEPMEVTLLRAGTGELTVVADGSTVASAYDDFDAPHRAVALRYGQIHCRIWQPATWLVAGESKAV
jgi:hypothetical protein